ncbi:MAG: C40 family peptidase [Aeromicrobium sp.]
MRKTTRNFACALLAASITVVGLAWPAEAESDPAPTNMLSLLLSPAPKAAPEPAPKPTPTTTPTVTPKPKTKRAPKAKPTRAQKLIKWAAKQKGDPYRYGANGPKSFDCSGLVQYVYKKAGKKIGRTSGDQLKGKHIAKSKKKKGDILIFISNGRAYHSAIYAGHGKMWEAQRSGTKVGKHKIWSSGYVVRRPK